MATQRISAAQLLQHTGYILNNSEAKSLQIIRDILGQLKAQADRKTPEMPSATSWLPNSTPLLASLGFLGGAELTLLYNASPEERQAMWEAFCRQIPSLSTLATAAVTGLTAVVGYNMLKGSEKVAITEDQAIALLLSRALHNLTCPVEDLQIKISACLQAYELQVAAHPDLPQFALADPQADDHGGDIAAELSRLSLSDASGGITREDSEVPRHNGEHIDSVDGPVSRHQLTEKAKSDPLVQVQLNDV